MIIIYLYVLMEKINHKIIQIIIDHLVYIETNVLGSENLVQACIESGVSKVVALSTDKASSPVNLYGAS